MSPQPSPCPSPCQCSCLSKSNDPAIPILGTGPGKNMTQEDTRTPVFAAPLFTITKTWKQTKCPPTEELIKKMWYIYTCHIFFIHSSVNGHLGCFHVLVIVNSAAVNIGVHVFFWIRLFSVHMPRSGTARSYGSTSFSVLRNHHAALHTGC